MNQTARIISIYAADTSGFCSALFEYGGMSVIHDASGCNSTYTTHDEPRWYDMNSMMYISGLTESDAVMGNDDKFVDDLVLAAEELKPRFIAICASALPAMVGIDMEAIAYEVETRTGIPAFEVKTNAMQSYITGAGNAFVELAKRFTRPGEDDVNFPKNEEGDGDSGEDSDRNNENCLSVNILGLTPLDFPLRGTSEAIRDWLEADGCKVNSYVGMHPADESYSNMQPAEQLYAYTHTDEKSYEDINSDVNKKKEDNLEEIVRLADADVSLVVSSIGMPLAKYLYEEFGIPYVIGAPFGKEFPRVLLKELQRAASEGESIDAVTLCRKVNSTDTVIIGESITSASLAAALLLDKGVKARVIESVGEGEMSVLIDSSDISCTEEDELEREIAKAETIIADPLFEPICRGRNFVRLPHAAFSGRCFTKEERELVNSKLSLANIKYINRN